MTALKVLAEMPITSGIFLQPPVPPHEPKRISGESDADFRSRYNDYHQAMVMYDSLMRMYNSEVQRIDRWLEWAHEPHRFVGRSSSICRRCWGWYDDARHW